jgi:hypothetical protein
MKDMILHIHWREADAWGKLTNRSIAVFSTYALFSQNVTKETIESYHRKATIELRKQKINKICSKLVIV